MAPTIFYITQGSTAPAITATLVDQYGNIANLTGATVKFVMTNAFYGNAVNAAAAIVNATQGLVSYSWQSADTANTGLFSCQWQVTFSGGSQETYPQGYYDQVSISPALNNGFPEIVQPTPLFNTIWSSASAPTSTQGNNGDYWYNTATGYFYGPKATGVWPAGAQINSSTIPLNEIAAPIGNVSMAGYSITSLPSVTNSTGVFDFNSSGTMAVPNGTDTLVTLALTQTLSNKTLASPVVTGTPTIPGLPDWLNVTTYGADPTGATDSTSAINSALAAAAARGGGTVYMPWGEYLVSGQISIPPYTFLVGQTSVTLNLFATPPTNAARIIASASWAPSSTSGIIAIQSKTPGGWSENTQSCGIKNLFIDGSLNSSTNLSGILLQGPVYDVHMEDIFIYKAPHNGIVGTTQTETGINPNGAYHQRYTRVTAVNCGNYGFGIGNSTDSTYLDCFAFANTAAGFNLQNNSNSNFVACRAEWNSSYGFQISGTTGSMVFTGCTTDQNSREGLYIDAVTAQTSHGGGIIWTGGKLHADANAAVSGHTNGILVTGSTIPVTISGTNVESGIDVNNSVYYPANALTITSSSYVTVTGSILQGITAAYNNGGSNTDIIMSGNIGATGDPNSQTFTLLPNLVGGVNTSQSAPVITPTFASGTAAQLSDTTRDYMVYFQIGTAGTAFSVKIGPTSTPANTIMASATPTADEFISFRLPAGWYAEWTGTSTTITTQTAIGC